MTPSTTSITRLLRDVRLAARSLVRRPTFTLTALLALGLGIGASAAVMGVVDVVLVRPLAYADADRLAVLLHDGRSPVSAANFLDWRRESRAFARMNAAESWGTSLTGDGAPERLRAMRITADMIPMLGVAPMLGRTFRVGEDEPGRERVVVLSHALWQRRFGGDPGVLGRGVLLDGVRHEVVGVMPPSFRFAPFWATNTELWAPLVLAPRAASRDGQSLRVFARLAPGVSLDAARAELRGITARLEAAFPGTNRDVMAVPLKEKVVGEVRPTLLLLLGAVAFVLLTACANVAHMLLARAASRGRELAVHVALGAPGAALLRRVLAESVLLALGGGLVGLAFGAIGIRALRVAGPRDLPRIEEIALDPRVVVATVGIALLCGVACGLVPAVRMARASAAATLRDGGRGSTAGARQRRGRRLLIASEFALAVVLLIGAGLMLRTVHAMQAVNPGFDARGVLTAVVAPHGARSAVPTRRAQFYEALRERARALPGVRSASLVNHVPLAGDVWGTGVSAEGGTRARPREELRATWRVVMPGYFETMRIALREGRDVSDADRLGTAGVVVVNEALAKRLWPGERAVGRRLTLEGGGPDAQWLTVVGVTADVVRGEWTAPPEGEVYVPYLQSRPHLEREGSPFSTMSLVVRTAGDPEALAPALRAAVRSLDPDVPLAEVQAMEAVVRRATARPRFVLLLLVSFAVVAATLAAVGLYGVTSYVVAQRTGEIGVRMALGARRGDIARLVVGESLGLVGVGVLAGLAGAAGLARLMAGLLYDVAPRDPVTFATVPLVLAAVALVAAWAPTLRAARTDPQLAMRTEA